MLYLLTPTDNRPEAFALLERWIGAQDWQSPFRWIVGTRDATGYEFHLNQIVVERSDTQGLHPLPSNLLACFEALSMGPGDLACVIEDDDFYLPGYLSRIAMLAEGVSLAGESRARYYHVGARRYRQNHNTGHASLAQTAFRADVLPLLRSICLRGAPAVDLALWREWQGSRRLSPTEAHVGIKGGPGAAGIGMGHRPTMGRPDEGGKVFAEWGIPSVYETYRWSSVKGS